MAAITRHKGLGHGGRRAGSFSGKTPGTGGGGGSARPPFGTLTRHSGLGHGARRVGSFAGKTPGTGSGGGGGGGGGRPDLGVYTRLGAAGFAATPFTVSVSPTLPGTLNATDLANIATAVWGKIIEAGLTAEMIQRILLAFAAGNVSGGPAGPQFFSIDGGKVRIGGTADQYGNRTRNSLDGSA